MFELSKETVTLSRNQQIVEAADRLNELLLDAAYANEPTTAYVREVYDYEAHIWFDKVFAHLAKDDESEKVTK